jgi:hypothetical protein
LRRGAACGFAFVPAGQRPPPDAGIDGAECSSLASPTVLVSVMSRAGSFQKNALSSCYSIFYFSLVAKPTKSSRPAPEKGPSVVPTAIASGLLARPAGLCRLNAAIAYPKAYPRTETASFLASRLSVNQLCLLHY